MFRNFLIPLLCRFATIASRPTVQNLITRLFVGRWSLRWAIWKCSWRRSATETRSSWGWAWTHRHPNRSWISSTSTIGWVEEEVLWYDLGVIFGKQFYLTLIGSYFALTNNWNNDASVKICDAIWKSPRSVLLFAILRLLRLIRYQFKPLLWLITVTYMWLMTGV